MLIKANKSLQSLSKEFSVIWNHKEEITVTQAVLFQWREIISLHSDTGIG